MSSDQEFGRTGFLLGADKRQSPTADQQLRIELFLHQLKIRVDWEATVGFTPAPPGLTLGATSSLLVAFIWESLSQRVRACTRLQRL